MEKTQRLQFITLKDNPRLTSQTSPGSSTTIRMQAMRDFVWKQSHAHDTRGASNPTSNTPVLQLDGFKGRFRLNSRPSKRALALRKKKGTAKVLEEDYQASSARGECKLANPSALTTLKPTTWLDGVFDPFNSYELGLEQQSLTLVNYYQQGYRLNLCALNVRQSDFFPSQPAEAGKFHALLYLVAFDYALQGGPTNEELALYQANKAYKLVNQCIYEENLSDATIAAVALIATKEALSGMWEAASRHMNGLEALVNSRGGLHRIRGLHQRVITWADFCTSSWRNSSPRLPQLVAPAVAGESSICPVFRATEILQALRRISKAMSEDTSFASREKLVSNDLYKTEYAIHNLMFADSASIYPVHDELESRTKAFCISAQLYIYLVIRNIPYQSPLIAKLVKRLQTTLAMSKMDLDEITRDQYNTDILLWTIFVGYCSSINEAERHWFGMQLQPYIHLVEDGIERALDERLRNVLWHDKWCEPNYWELEAGL